MRRRCRLRVLTHVEHTLRRNKDHAQMLAFGSHAVSLNKFAKLFIELYTGWSACAYEHAYIISGYNYSSYAYGRLVLICFVKGPRNERCQVARGKQCLIPRR